MNKASTARFSRRRFGQLAAAAPLAVATASGSPQAGRGEQERPATASRPTTSEAIAKFDVPMAAEPGFVFRP